MTVRYLKIVFLLLPLLLLSSSLPARAEENPTSQWPKITCDENVFIDVCHYAEVYRDLDEINAIYSANGLPFNFFYETRPGKWLGSLATQDALLANRLEKFYGLPSHAACGASFLPTMMPALRDVYLARIIYLERVQQQVREGELTDFYPDFLYSPDMLPAFKDKPVEVFDAFLKINIQGYIQYIYVLDQGIKYAHQHIGEYGLDVDELARLIDLKKLLFMDERYMGAMALRHEITRHLAQLARLQQPGRARILKCFLEQKLIFMNEGLKFYAIARNWQHYQATSHPQACREDFLDVFAWSYLSAIDGDSLLREYERVIERILSYYPQAYSQAEIDAYRQALEKYRQAIAELLALENERD